MKSYISVLIGIIILIAVSCGKAPVQKGDEAFQEQKYSEALKYYLEAVKKTPDDPALKEKIATTFFKEGEIFWEKRHVLKAFEARVQQGLKYVPENPSSKMKRQVSDAYFNLALAYKNTNAENPFQKEQFFNNALENLKKSELFDSTNVKVNEAIAELKTENFQKYLDRGVSAFRKGTRDALQYINADIYLTNALRLDPESETARSYLKKAREKSLNVLDPGQDVPFAVTDQMENGEYLAFLIVLHNQLSNSISVNAGNFYLVNENGKQVQGKNSGMFSTPLEPSSVANGDEIAGVVAFPLPVNKNGARLEFKKDGDLLGYKNLP